MIIKELPSDERPRERLQKFGPSTLSNVELLAILLRTGSKSEGVISLASKLLKGEGDSGIQYIAKATVEELQKFEGIGLAKAVQLKAAVELGKRLAVSEMMKRGVITSPQDVARYIMEDMRYLTVEHFKIILLNIKNHILSVETVSVGNINTSIVDPKEVFRVALNRGCASIILVHNHPSGDPSPSGEDISITRRLKEGGEILGIQVLDHIVIGDGKFISLKEKGLM